jgi:hypothetical protein
MTKSPKPIEQKRSNKNRHYRSTLNPKVRKLIEFLRSGWAAMGAVERGQRIKKLVSVGCSKRGLGRELGVSESSIRKHAEIADLPESDRKAIDSGASAKKILTQKAAAERQAQRQKRVDDDERTGALSNKIATTILEFCRAGKELRKDPMIRGAFPRLLDNVESHLRDFEAAGRRAVKVSKNLEPRELFRKTRPRAARNTRAGVRQAEWLAEVLWLLAPESPIRASAILKARKRASELLGMTPIELFVNAELNRRAKIIELSNYSPKKDHPGGARSIMQRQGPAPPPADPDSSGNTDSKP